MNLLSENSLAVLEKRYLARNEKGEVVENAEGLFNRVAECIANVDSLYKSTPEEVALTKKEFLNLMTNLEFLPNSPTLMNAGRPLGQLAACFVLSIKDTMEDIFDTVKNSALIHKSGGGTGFSFSNIRPKGSIVNSTGGVASGPVSFMKVFNAATEAVKQGGVRRGANMGMLRVDHPDILEFISCKEDNSEITNFNISIAITDDFMSAVENDNLYHLVNPKDGYVIIPPIKARTIWEKIIDMAWKNGEPGIIFIDRMNQFNPTPEIGLYESTNPCGEQVLLPEESCNLGSINLMSVLTEINGKSEIDYEKLKRIVYSSVHFLDNVIDANKYPLKIIEEKTKDNRKIGLGVMGWADLLLSLKIPYNSDTAYQLANKVMEFIQTNAWEASKELASKRGVFPNYGMSKFFELGERYRNATTTTIAPTGTLSIIVGVSSGIEPLFAISYIRNVMDGEELIEVNPIFEKVAKERGFYSKELMKKIAEIGTIQHMEEIPKDVRDVFVTSHDISSISHVCMQASFQTYVDNAVSKTVNLPNSASKLDVEDAFLNAYELKCKGVTIYRDGSRDLQVLNIKEVKGKETKQETKQETIETQKSSCVPRLRKDILSGITEKVKIGCGNLYITVNKDDIGICEVFTNTGRAGGCSSQSEATSRIISIALRAGVDEKSIIEQLKGIRCPSTIRKKDLTVMSCPDAIGRTIERLANPSKELVKHHSPNCDSCSSCSIKEDCNAPSNIKELERETSKCPECGSPVAHESGCISCKNCGWGKCI